MKFALLSSLHRTGSPRFAASAAIVSPFSHLLRILNAEAAAFAVRAIIFSGAGIALLIGFIVARRAIRRRYFDRLADADFYVRQHWNAILSGEIPPSHWRAARLDREAVMDLALERLDVADQPEREILLSFLRASGLLGRLLFAARRFRGWRREAALVRLGRTRAPEAVPVLAAALDDRHANTQLAAVRGLARTGLPSAAEAMLERFVTKQLSLEGTSLLNALIACTQANPRIVLPYLFTSHGERREVLARVISEIPPQTASADLRDDLLRLAGDSSPEVRASAARALAHTEFGFAFPALAALSEDPQWFVRLRAVTALGEFADAGAMPVMLRALCDRNRLVRQRAAEALARIPDSISVLQGVLETRDSYALQALIAELDRAGNFARVSELLESGANRLTHAESLRLLRALETGAEELRAMMHIPANQKRLQTA